LRRIDRSRQKADADIGFEQSQQILVRRNLMAMVGIQSLCTQHRGKVVALLAVAPQEKTLGLEIIEGDRLLAPEAMRSAEDHVERLLKELPAVKPVPGLADRSSHGEFGVTGLEVFDDLRPGAAQDLELDVAEALS
jgi:hypothetical protein